MILDGVDVFVKVVQAGSFSAAARLLGMPTTTVSAKIARLEQRLGVSLVQRTTRRMHVTAAGEAYYANCLEALAALEAGEAQLLAQSGEPSGLLRITAPSDIAQVLLPPIIERFIATYPKISLDLLVTNTPVDLLAEGVDLAIRASPMRDSTLQRRKFIEGKLRFFASKNYLQRNGTPIVPTDLAEHALIIHSRFPSDILERIAARGGFEKAARARVTTDDMHTLRALVARGMGIALLPDFGDPTNDRDGLVRVLPDFATPSGTIYFVYPGGKFTPVNVRAFVDMALEMAD